MDEKVRDGTSYNYKEEIMNINYLKTQLKTRNISIYKLSKLTGLDDGMLNRIINGKTTKPQITTIVKIAKALDLDDHEFAELCGYVE